MKMTVFADANYVDKADDRKLVSGVAVVLVKSVISWPSSIQGVTALWTAQADYMATGDGVKECLFVCKVCAVFSSFRTFQRSAS